MTYRATGQKSCFDWTKFILGPLLSLRAMQKALAIAIPFFFLFSFSYSSLLPDGLATVFINNFSQLLLSTCVTKIGSPSLDTQTDYCVYVLKFRACEHGKPYDLEINSNGGLKRGHVQSCLRTTKNIISLLPQCLWPPCLAGW